MRPVLRLKKNAAAKPISTRVIKGVASPNRNQAIIHGGKEIEMSLIVAAAARENRRVRLQLLDRSPNRALNVDALGSQSRSILCPPSRQTDGNSHQADAVQGVNRS